MWRRITLLLVCAALTACGEQPSGSAQAMPEQSELGGTQWRVEDIDGSGVIDRSNVTIEIVAPDEIAGSAGCNRYFGTLHTGVGKFEVSAMGNTSMACVPAIADQEKRFLDALAESATYEADATFLRIRDASGNERIRAVLMPAPQREIGTVPADSVDAAAPVVHRFDCGNSLDVTIEFVGPETLKIGMPDGSHFLNREISASGAKYAGDGITFWNKGREALLVVGGVEHQCMTSGEKENNPQ